MMRSRLVKTLLFSILISFMGWGCTSSQTNAIDDEMLSETEVTDDTFAEDSSFGDVSQGGEDLDSFDFADESVAENEIDDLDSFDFDDFESSDPGQLQAEADQMDHDDLAAELDLDDLSADDVVQTPEPPPIDMQAEFSETELDFDEDASLDLAETPIPTADSSMVEITDIRFLSNQAGGTVVIDANRSLPFETRFNPQTGQFVIEAQNAVLPERLKRPYLMKDFVGSFGSINAYQAPGDHSVRVVIQLKPGLNEEPAVRMEGTSLVVVPPALSASSVAAIQDVSPKKPSATGGALGAGTLEEFLLTNQKFFGKPISLQVRNADIRDVIGFISEESGANIVMSDQVSGGITLKLRKIPWDQALVTIMRTKGLGYVRQGNVIRISTMEELRKESATATELLKAQKELAPLKVKVIPVNYANVESLNLQVKEFLSKEGKVVVDARSNSILITDREDVLDKITRLIGALDISPNQVLIEGKIVEASEEFQSTIGVRWSASGAPVTVSQEGGTRGSPLELSGAMKFGEAGQTAYPNSLGIRFGSLDFLGNLSAMLNLAETDRTAKVISSPRVVAMNREKAEIGQTGEVISVVTIQNGVAGNLSTTENRIPVNLKLSVTPQITSDGSVIMDLDVIRQFAGPIVNQVTQSRPINSRTAKTRVLVRNGETSVIGGIYQVDEGQTVEGVPGLKDVPLLGWLFKTRERTKQKNELLIFLTPRILAVGTDQRAASL